MKKIIVSDDIAKLICLRYQEGNSIHAIVLEAKVTRRVVERTLKDNGYELKTKSQLIQEQFPILNDRDGLIAMYNGKNIEEVFAEIIKSI